MKRKKHWHISVKNQVILIILLIFLITGLFFVIFNSKVTPRLTHVGELEFQKVVDRIASDYGIMQEFQTPIENLLKITKNNKGEILTVDYQMSQIYAMSHLITDYLNKSVESIEEGNLPIDFLNDELKKGNNGILLMMPLGVVSDYLFLSNLGPRIPVLVRFIDSVYTNVKTKLTNYGINNALIEVYLEVSISYELITPVLKEAKTLDYSILLNAKIIQGTVPNWYGTEMITKSNGVKESIS